jgi:photosystem II stability/assembly factor-like uncharacterized protein
MVKGGSMISRTNFSVTSALAVIVLGFASAGHAVPVLTPGVWTRITPSTLGGGANLMAIDPSNHDIIYLTGSHGDKLGLLKSTDRGSTWLRIGNPPASPNYGDTVDYLDAPFKVRVDPADPSHMYATEMSPGGTVCWGFWVTHNGGAKWVRTKGFTDAVKASNGSTDVGHFDVDPADFNHVIISSHYYWNGSGASGIFETRDGGNTFIVHNPASGMGSASKSVCFLYEPALGIGNKDTWLVVEDMSTMWRTTDAGANWTKVYAGYTPHGGTIGHCYTKSGVVYTGGWGAPTRSSDNGITWELAPSAPYGAYCSIASDGEKLYISHQTSTTWSTSLETDGAHWAAYSGTALPSSGAADIQFDSVNRIMYSMHGASGLWALKVQGNTATENKFCENRRQGKESLSKISISIRGRGPVAARIKSTTPSEAGFFDIRGRAVSLLL